MICDLDGTLLAVNSFRNWVVHLLAARFPGLGLPQRCALSAHSMLAMLERKLLRCDHAVTKGRLQRLWAKAVAHDPSGLALLVTSLQSTVRPCFVKLLHDIADARVDAVMATAASADYAVPLGQALGFRHILATPFTPQGAVEQNVGTVKRDRTLNFLRAQGWELRQRLVFTDHIEDQPLMAVANSVIWLGNPADIDALRTQLPSSVRLEAAAQDADALLGQTRSIGLS